MNITTKSEAESVVALIRKYTDEIADMIPTFDEFSNKIKAFKGKLSLIPFYFNDEHGNSITVTASISNKTGNLEGFEIEVNTKLEKGTVSLNVYDQSAPLEDELQKAYANLVEIVYMFTFLYDFEDEFSLMNYINVKEKMHTLFLTALSNSTLVKLTNEN